MTFTFEGDVDELLDLLGVADDDDLDLKEFEHAMSSVVSAVETVGGPARMGPLQKIRARRAAAELYSKQEGIGLRAAMREISAVENSASAEQLASAVDLDAADFSEGLFSAKSVKACCVAAGVALPVDGPFQDFFAWLFSEEGLNGLMAFVETIVKIIAILGPLFI